MVLRWLCLALVLVAGPAVAQTGVGFDAPVKAVTTTGFMAWTTCVYYRDVMIQTGGVDLPELASATILPNHDASALGPCRFDMEWPDTIIVRSPGYDMALIGRKGRFLVFGFSDPPGIQIFDVTTGRALFEDGIYGSVTTVTLSQGVLHMRYNRAVGAKCSLVTDNAGCWARILASGALPRNVDVRPPTSEVCRKSYDKAFYNIYGTIDPRRYDYPSVVSYAVDLTLDGAGHATMRASGPLSCELQS